MTNSSRKFIELIHAVSSKWANWDPPTPIKVGDYGTVDKQTGRFESDGNIYDDADIANLTSAHRPHQTIPENSFIVSSSSVKRHELTLDHKLNIPGVAEASINTRWEFGAKRGALLIMARPRTSHILRNVLLKLLVDVPDLQNKSLVTEVVSCPAYVLYLSSGNKEVIDVELVGSVPVPDVSTFNASGATGMAWRSRNTTGLFREACDQEGLYSYTPLFTLKKIRRRGLLRRESPVPEPEGDDLWIDTQEPWDALDEDGEEEEFEDTIFV